MLTTGKFSGTRHQSLQVGLGLRPPYYRAASLGEVSVDWWELVTENFMVPGGRPRAVLDSVSSHYPISFHGVSMNLGGTDPLEMTYLNRLRELVTDFNPLYVSDHLCWTRHGGHHLHDLLPLPYADDVVTHVATRVRQVQDILGRQILIENLSSYAELDWNSMREWDFLSAVAEEANCLILLDLNNIIVSAHNHGFDPLEYINAVPPERVAHYHLAGHSSSGPLKIDTHDNPISEDVWSLYQVGFERFGQVPICLERDDNLPPLNALMKELHRARHMASEFAIL